MGHTVSLSPVIPTIPWSRESHEQSCFQWCLWGCELWSVKAHAKINGILFEVLHSFPFSFCCTRNRLIFCFPNSPLPFFFVPGSDVFLAPSERCGPCSPLWNGLHGGGTHFFRMFSHSIHPISVSSLRLQHLLLASFLQASDKQSSVLFSAGLLHP